MPELDSMQNIQTQSNFQFSAIGLDELEATEYTLATVVVDLSGSVSGWERQLEDCLKAIVNSCKRSPRSDNLILRVVQFNDSLTEIHGFKELNTIGENEYTNTLQASGSTSLYDAVLEAAEATTTYGEMLTNQDYMANGVIYVLTDGMDNTSRHNASQIKDRILSVKRDEVLDSMAVILVGIGHHGASQYLDNFKQEAEITQFVDLEDLFNKTSPEGALAKLAGYVSRSISSTSQALASGNSTPMASNLTF